MMVSLALQQSAYEELGRRHKFRVCHFHPFDQILEFVVKHCGLSPHGRNMGLIGISQIFPDPVFRLHIFVISVHLASEFYKKDIVS